MTLMSRTALKTLPGVLVIVAAAGLGLALGSALRARHLPKSTSTPPGSAAKSAGGLRQAAVLGRPDDSPLATQLERDLSMATAVTRWLYWLDAVERAMPADFPRLVRLARGNYTATRLVAERWAQVAPRQMFGALLAASKNITVVAPRELADVLFDQWIKRDPQGVIAALNEPGARGVAWRIPVAGHFIESDVELGLRLYSEWKIDCVGVPMNPVTAWAAADPPHAAQYTLEHPAGLASSEVMEAVGKAWAATDPAQALAFATGQPSPLGTVLANAVMKAWAGRDLSAAGDWLAQADPQVQSRLSGPFVEAWAKSDPDAALAWCQDNLSGSALIRAVSEVVSGAADKDVVAAAGLVAAMDPSAARADAAVAVAQKWLGMFLDASGPRLVPPEAIAWLSGLDAGSMRRVLDRFQWQWADADPTSLAAFLASASSDAVPASAYATLAARMVRDNPAGALQWCAGLPGGLALSAGREAFEAWRYLQPDAAMTWLCALPADDPRRPPFFQNAVRFIAYGPQGADVLAALSPADRAAAQTVIDGLSLAPEQRSRLLQALRRP
jgi:hypothetical protein